MLLSFALMQKKVTKGKIKFRTQPPHIAFALVYETGLTEPLSRLFILQKKRLLLPSTNQFCLSLRRPKRIVWGQK
jgi:hypothetical protein